MYVYKITNMINGKMYIGMHEGEMKNYMGSGKLLKYAIKKYGIKNFRCEILEECSSVDELRNAEARWIEKTNAVESNLYYNMMDGGKGGDTGFKPETRMSEVVKGVWDNYTEEERQARRQKVKESLDYDKSGSNNPKAKKAMVNGKIYDCLKDALIDYPNIPYSSLKRFAQKGTYNKKYNVKVEYVK